MGRGNMTVEFFSADIEFKVWKSENYIRTERKINTAKHNVNRRAEQFGHFWYTKVADWLLSQNCVKGIQMAPMQCV